MEHLIETSRAHGVGVDVPEFLRILLDHGMMEGAANCLGVSRPIWVWPETSNLCAEVRLLPAPLPRIPDLPELRSRRRAGHSHRRGRRLATDVSGGGHGGATRPTEKGRDCGARVPTGTSGLAGSSLGASRPVWTLRRASNLCAEVRLLPGPSYEGAARLRRLHSRQIPDARVVAGEPKQHAWLGSPLGREPRAVTSPRRA